MEEKTEVSAKQWPVYEKYANLRCGESAKAFCAEKKIEKMVNIVIDTFYPIEDLTFSAQ